MEIVIITSSLKLRMYYRLTSKSSPWEGRLIAGGSAGGLQPWVLVLMRDMKYLFCMLQLSRSATVNLLKTGQNGYVRPNNECGNTYSHSVGAGITVVRSLSTTPSNRRHQPRVPGAPSPPITTALPSFHRNHFALKLIYYK